MTAPNSRERILPRLIDEEIKESFINYSMSVIVSRALPDVRDGLKPVQRRVLFAMNELGLTPNRAYKKSATVVGDVLGKYHPHGDSSVYDALVRMVQSFSLRYPLVDGQGNFGSVDGDPAAAYRYTEARLSRVATELLADYDKNTVDFAPNFDDRLQEPTVLPSAVPNLLVNGSSGIAVGMATNIPPHNLREIVAALHAIIDDPELSVDAMRRHIRGPDFPTGAYIYGKQGIADYIATGRGRIVMRAAAVIEEKESSNKSQIVVTELPYQVNKARLVEQIADLHREGKVEGISALRDESDRDGMRVVVELKRDAIPRVVLNQLYKHSTMQSTFGVIMLALVPDPATRRLVPKVMPVKTVLEHFVSHRHEVIVRRTQFELDKALEREHILEGLKIAVDNIDAVIKLIRAAADTPTASASSSGASSSASGRPRRSSTCASPSSPAWRSRSSRPSCARCGRRSPTCAASSRAARGACDHEGRARRDRRPLRRRAPQRDHRRRGRVLDRGPDRRGGHGRDHLPLGLHQAHAGHHLPQAAARRARALGAVAQGHRLHLAAVHREHARLHHDLHGRRPVLLAQGPRDPGGRARHARQADRQPDQRRPRHAHPQHGRGARVPRRPVPVLLHAQRHGQEDALADYGNVRATGIKAIKIEDDDELIDVQITSGTNDVVLATKHGLSVRFPEADVRPMGRDTTGVKGVTLRPEDKVVSMVVVRRADATLLVVTGKGMGKVTDLSEYRVQGRGGKGILTLNRTDKTGNVVAVREVVPDEEIMLITKNGVIIRSPVNQVRNTGRNAQGVKLVNLDDKDEVCAVATVVVEKDEGDDAVSPAPDGGLLLPDGDPEMAAADAAADEG
jgi:DNA gyrase subunit A